MAGEWGRDVNGDVLELLATLGGTVPAHAGRYVSASDPAEVVLRCTMDLAPDQREAFLAAFDEPWTLLLICNDWHPQLEEICAWVDGRDATLLLATPSGPPIPAVAIFTRPAEGTHRDQP